MAKHVPYDGNTGKTPPQGGESVFDFNANCREIKDAPGHVECTPRNSYLETEQDQSDSTTFGEKYGLQLFSCGLAVTLILIVWWSFTRQINWKKCSEAISITFVLLLGCLGWGITCAVVGWLFGGLDQDVQKFAIFAWLSSYLFVVIAVFRRWKEARTLFVVSPAERFNYLTTAWSVPLGMIATLAIFSAIWLWGWQIIYWLRRDHWTSLDIISLVKSGGAGADGPREIFGSLGRNRFTNWLISPLDWVGLQRVVSLILSWITPSIIFLFVGFQCLMAGDVQRNLREKLIRQSKELGQSG